MTTTYVWIGDILLILIYSNFYDKKVTNTQILKCYYFRIYISLKLELISWDIVCVLKILD